MSVPLMGLRLFTEAVSPIVDLLTVWQRGQAEAARAAQGSSLEVAQAAGEAAASGVGKFFMDTKPWLSASPNPWQAMMADTMRPVLQQTIGQMMGKLMGLFSQGKPNLQPAAPTGMPGESGSKLPPIRGGRRQPGGIQEATDDEIREVFGDD